MQRIVTTLFSRALEDQRDLHASTTKGPSDQEMIALMADPDNSNKSADKLKKWLKKYQVLQGIGANDRLAVAKKSLRVIRQMRRENLTIASGDVDAILGAYRRLCVATNNALSGRRKFESGASKILWLVFPDVVPMLDRNVEVALRALSWTMTNEPQLAANQRADRYEIFLRHWFFYYEQAAPHITQCMMRLDGRRRYQYDVRVFDKILWYVGCEKYQCEFTAG